MLLRNNWRPRRQNRVHRHPPSECGTDSDAGVLDAKQMLERLGCNVELPRSGNKNKRKKVEGDSQSQTSLGPGTRGTGPTPGRPSRPSHWWELIAALPALLAVPAVRGPAAGPRLAMASINSTSWSTFKADPPSSHAVPDASKWSAFARSSRFGHQPMSQPQGALRVVCCWLWNRTNA